MNTMLGLLVRGAVTLAGWWAKHVEHVRTVKRCAYLLALLLVPGAASAQSDSRVQSATATYDADSVYFKAQFDGPLPSLTLPNDIETWTWGFGTHVGELWERAYFMRQHYPNPTTCEIWRQGDNSPAVLVGVAGVVLADSAIRVAFDRDLIEIGPDGFGWSFSHSDGYDLIERIEGRAVNIDPTPIARVTWGQVKARWAR